MKAVIVIPTYNERDNIEPIITEIFAVTFDSALDIHILVVDDSSPDGTAEIVKKLMGSYPKLHLITGQKNGLGDAYVRGFRHAMESLKADVVVEMDADGQHPPAALPSLLDPLRHDADVAVGTRYIKGGAVPANWGFLRKFLSGFGNYVARVILLLPQYHDMTTGFRATKTSLMKEIDLDSLYSKRFAYKIHLFYLQHKAKAKIVEVPLVFVEREKGSSKMITNDIIESLRVIFMIRILASREIIKFLIVGTIGFLVNAVLLKLLYNTSVGNFLHPVGTPGTFLIFPLADYRLFWASVIAVECSIVSNFLFHENWTFKRRQRHGNPLLRLARFNASSIVSPIISVTAVNILTPHFGLPLLLSLAIGTILGLTWNYTVNVLWIWRAHPKEEVAYGS